MKAKYPLPGEKWKRINSNVVDAFTVLYTFNRNTPNMSPLIDTSVQYLGYKDCIWHRLYPTYYKYIP